MKTVSISIQALFWGLLLFTVPIFVYVSEYSLANAMASIPFALKLFFPILFIFYANYLLLIPRLLDKNKVLFIVSNLVFAGIFTLIRALKASAGLEIPVGVSFSKGAILAMMSTTMLFLHLIFTLLAIGVAYTENYFVLKERAVKQKQEATEAELSWLKSQLNPHFLFNTLNNISSLTHIDADKAQDSIGQLSELLRYAMYDTTAELVPLSGEMDFLSNYIDLMALRCNERTTITKDFDVSCAGNIKVAPLLFICPVENAFKHGVNVRDESFVDVSLKREGNDLVFICRNSIVESKRSDRVGSGIGLANLQKRLDLIYKGQYEFSSGAQDNVYTSTIKLKGICSDAL